MTAGLMVITDTSGETALAHRAVQACARAKSELLSGRDHLARVREAGALLRQVRRTPGVRTSSTRLTRFQAVIEEAGVSRQAAHVWQKAAAVDDGVVKEYIDAAIAASLDITAAGLLAWATRPDAGGDEVPGANGEGEPDPPTHVCPSCGVLIACDREAGR